MICPGAGHGGYLGGGDQHAAGVGPGEGRTLLAIRSVVSLLMALTSCTFREGTTCTTSSSQYISGNLSQPTKLVKVKSRLNPQ